MRLFYAVFLPEEVRAALVEAQTKVRPFRGWKPVPPHQLHLTLLFLGERPEEELPDYLALGHRLARLRGPLPGAASRDGLLPQRRNPPGLVRQGGGRGLPPPRRGASRRGGGASGRGGGEDPWLGQALQAPHHPGPQEGPGAPGAPVLFGLEWPVEGFALVRSELKPKGPVYTVLEKFSLRGEHGREQAQGPGERPEGD